MNRIISFVKSFKPIRVEHWILLSLLFYSLRGVLKYYIPLSLCNVVAVVSALMFIVVIMRNVRKNPLSGTVGFVYGFLIFWSVCLTFHMFCIADVRSTFPEYNGITTWLLAYFNSSYFLPNLIPFIILVFPRNYSFDFGYLWRIMWLMCVLYLCYYPFAFWSMTHYSWSMDSAGMSWGDEGTYGDFITNSTIGISSLAPVVIMVFFKKYLSVTKWRWFFTAYVGSIIISAFLARRGGLAISVLYLFLAWMMYTLSNKKSSKVKQIIIAILIVGLGFVVFSSYADSFFATLIERGTDDSRSGVEYGFYADMKDISDWIFGRGWFGQYYDLIFGKFRLGLETGYLTLILRGGFFYLVPYVLILLLTFINGYFKSRNLFCKSFAILCLMQMLSLYPFGWPAFNFFHFVLWLGVWVCNNGKLRYMNNEQISRLCFD